MKNFWLDRKKAESRLARSQWDFQTALGDANKANYESLYVRLVEVKHFVNRKPYRIAEETLEQFPMFGQPDTSGWDCDL